MISRYSLSLFASASIVLPALAISSARADVSSIHVYNDAASFLQAAPIVSTETFDEVAAAALAPSSQVIIDSIIYNSVAGGSWATSSVAHGATAPNALIGSLIGTKTLDFGQYKAVNAIGFYMVFPGVSDPPHLSSITVTTSVGDQIARTFGPKTAADQLMYWGFTSADGITSVKIENSPNPAGGWNYYFDNVSRGAMILAPEPSGSMLFLAVVFTLRRRSNSKR